MQRRRFLAQAAGAAGAGLAAVGMPAMAQANPTVRWRMSTSWPKSLDTIYGSADELCKRVGQLTDGKFEIRAFPGGELVPSAQNMDAVSNGTVECNHVLSTMYIGKNTALTFDTGLSFGLNARQHNAWIHYGGGCSSCASCTRNTTSSTTSVATWVCRWAAGTARKSSPPPISMA